MDKLGVLYMKRQRTGVLSAGSVGYLTGSIRRVQETKVGDTVTHSGKPCAEAIAGFREVKPMVFSGIYPQTATISRICARRLANYP